MKSFGREKSATFFSDYNLHFEEKFKNATTTWCLSRLFSTLNLLFCAIVTCSINEIIFIRKYVKICRSSYPNMKKKQCLPFFYKWKGSFIKCYQSVCFKPTFGAWQRKFSSSYNSNLSICRFFAYVYKSPIFAISLTFPKFWKIFLFYYLYTSYRRWSDYIW